MKTKKLRIIREIKRITRRPFYNYLNPFHEKQRHLIIHCCYHKVGTVWFHRVLSEVAYHFGMKYINGISYEQISKFETEKNADIFLDQGSHVNIDLLDNYRGSHMIRDPRDMIISAYFYHKWTDETWANIPMAEYRGMSYKQYLNSLDKTEGLLVEIERSQFWINHMANWDFHNPLFYEIKYENIRLNEEKVFFEMFSHYGFSEKAIKTACSIAKKYTFERVRGSKNKKSHLRSGKIGEWSEHFEPIHKERFKELYPGVLKKLGYEKDDDW